MFFLRVCLQIIQEYRKYLGNFFVCKMIDILDLIIFDFVSIFKVINIIFEIELKKYDIFFLDVI